MHGLPPLEDCPNFERMRQALLCQEPARVPIAELKVNDEVKSAFLGQCIGDPDRDLEGYLKNDIRFSVEAGYDFVRLMALGEFPLAPEEEGTAKPTTKASGAPVREWANESARLISTEKDLENFPFPKADEIVLDPIQLGVKLMPAGMKAFTSIKGGGIFERAWRLMGFEEFCVASVEKLSLVEKLINTIGAWYCEVFQRIAEIPGVAGLWLPDDLAYTEAFMVSPQLYRRYLFPWYEKLAGICRQQDLFFLLHCDGRIWEILEDIIALGFHALHPIEPKAMDIREVKARVKGRLCLIGNVDLDYPLSRGTPQEVEEEVKSLIRDLAPAGGWCLGSSNSIPEYVPLENYLALLKAGRKWGRYPINLG